MNANFVSTAPSHVRALFVLAATVRWIGRVFVRVMRGAVRGFCCIGEALNEPYRLEYSEPYRPHHTPNPPL